MKKRLDVSIFILILLMSSTCLGASLSTPIQEQSERKLSLVVRSGYSQADNSNAGVTFYEFGTGVNFALSRQYALTAEVSQGLLTSNFGTGFTSMGLGIEYSLMGTNSMTLQEVAIQDYKMFDMQGRPSPSLSISINARQVFFNGSTQVFPFTGIGSCIKYRPFQTSTGYWGADVCYDYLLNPPNTTSMIRAMLGWSVFLF